MAKSKTYRLPFFTYKQLRFATDRVVVEGCGTGRSLTVQLAGAEPVAMGQQCKILSLGFLIQTANGRIRIGFLKRHHVIEKR